LFQRFEVNVRIRSRETHLATLHRVRCLVFKEPPPAPARVPTAGRQFCNLLLCNSLVNPSGETRRVGRRPEGRAFISPAKIDTTRKLDCCQHPLTQTNPGPYIHSDREGRCTRKLMFKASW